MKHQLSAALVILGTLGLSAATAAEDETAADIRCVVVSMGLSQSDDAALKTAGLLSAMYYLGRLDGHAPNLDLENGFFDEIQKMNPAELQSEAMRCGRVLRERGMVLTDIGRNLIRRGQSGDGQSPP
jgi:hypothetical protein